MSRAQSELEAIGLTPDMLGAAVREAWVRWAQEQPNPKPSWLVPWDELSEADREADRRIGVAVAAMAILLDRAATAARELFDDDPDAGVDDFGGRA